MKPGSMALWLFLAPLLLFSCAHHPLEDRVRKSGTVSQDPNCRPLSNAMRQRLLSLAHPTNFPSTRYSRRPSSLKSIEKSTDCSHFVHEIYRRAGLPYAFRATAELGNATEFDLLPESEARAGDLMLFKGHVGIVDEDGKIISALRTRRNHRKSSIGALDRRYFKPIHGKRYVLRYRCQPAGAEDQVAATASARGRNPASHGKR